SVMRSQDLYFAQVQTVSLTGAIAGTTQFNLTYNGVTTPAITYTGTAADAATVMAKLNALATIGGIGASVSVTQVGSTFFVTFGGSLGGMEIPELSGSITSSFGTGFIS